jgi:ammonium transporter, Amt family
VIPRTSVNAAARSNPYFNYLGGTVRKKALKYLAGGIVGSLVGVLAVTGSALAADEDPIVTLGHQTNLLWVIIGAVLVIFMQAGFALVETGFCTAKHAAHVVTTNFAIFGLGFIGFFFVGFPLAFGGFDTSALLGEGGKPVGHALLGSGNWTFLWQGGWALSGSHITPAVVGIFLYMVAFMDTTATIPTGSMAERWKWNSFVVWGLFCGAIYYPLFAAWTWGGGWLAKTWDTMSLGAGYVDFAGSGVVHAVGGVAAFAGAKVLGPRMGKFGPDGKPRTIAGHHIPMAMLGTFILLFGWFGFNAASTFAVTDVQFSVVAVNTAIAAAFGAIAAMFWAMKRLGKPDPGMMANGMLAGLVAITAPCAFTSPAWSALIGVIAAVVVCEAIGIIETKFKIDDPVGAISVHGVGGILGVLFVGIFANGSYGAGWNGSSVTGVEGVVNGKFGQLGAQMVGAAVIIVVIGGLAYGFFSLQNKLTKGGIRSSEADEIAGLDMGEMGVLAYPEFAKTSV